MRKRINRRRKTRAACLLVVRYRRRADRASPWLAASVVDLSDSGCRLRIAEQLRAGTLLLLRFGALLHDGATSAEVDARAVVTWCRAQGGWSYEVGLELPAAPAELNEILGALASA